MRHLNKIVFIHSANIPYAEVMLDGNVHFAGTQGVGKSTVLRALLFFYNADKLRLGIQPGQKSFEEFYFPHNNSFIVYEVRKDQQFYSILAYRNKGKVVYHFIDLPYAKSWLVDEDGKVEHDWSRIRSRILEATPKADISNLVETYDLYRNIIFGNTHDRSHRYDKYALVESSKYQNIPRSIQNVFLNSKLDADFVKTTIIQSMSEVEDSIKLSDYRHWVVGFEKEFDDIECWYKKDAKGEVAVRNKANKVVDTYRTFQALDFEMRQSWHQLSYAVNHTREQLPVVEDECRSLTDRVGQIQTKLNSVQQEYDKENELLIGKISECNTRLKDIRKKRKEYESLDICSMLELDRQKPKFLGEKAEKERILHTLEKQFEDVTEKYRQLYAALEAEMRNFQLMQQQELNDNKAKVLDEKQRLQQVRDKLKKTADEEYREAVELSDTRMSALQEECSRANMRLSELKYWHPKEKECAACQEEIHRLEKQQQEAQTQLAIVRNQLQSLRQEAMLRQKEVQKNYELRQTLAQSELERLKADLAATEGILDRYNGSFYEWLEQNKPGWEQTIGRVVDEHCVLYAQGLMPELCDTSADGNESSASDSLFGVRLNWEAIPDRLTSPAAYREQHRQLQQAVKDKRKELGEFSAACEEEVKKVGLSYKGQLSDLQQQESNWYVQNEQLPLKIKDTHTRLHLLQREEEQLAEEEREKRMKAYNEALVLREKEITARKQLAAHREKECKAADKAYTSDAHALDKKLDDFLKQQEKESAARKAEWTERRKTVEGQERQELEGVGADTKAIDACRNDIMKVQQLLNKIEEQHKFVLRYRDDEEQLFSHETDFQEEKKKFELRQSQLQQNKEDKLQRFRAELSEVRDSLNTRQEISKQMKEGLRQYDQFCNGENQQYASLLEDDALQETSLSCQELIGNLRVLMGQKRSKFDHLKSAANSFRSHFSDENCFHFPIPQYDAEYLDFARNLQDFLDHDMIEDFRQRVSESYCNILSGISREVGNLLTHSAEIKGIINEVNRDFKENNFAGVIRSIELRAEESSDPMMLTLRSIHNFWLENNLNVGQPNLFAGNERDKANAKVVEYIKKFVKQLQKEPSRTVLTLSDTFRLQFRIQENDNSTGWVERVNNVGSDGTDILVKAMVNIMLINVFKRKAARKHGDFVIHCMMDEIGKLHPSNVKGILQFANVRNIYLLNCSPMGYNADIYKYNYLLTKDSKARTHVKRLITVNG